MSKVNKFKNRSCDQDNDKIRSLGKLDILVRDKNIPLTKQFNTEKQQEQESEVAITSELPVADFTITPKHILSTEDLNMYLAFMYELKAGITENMKGSTPVTKLNLNGLILRVKNATGVHSTYGDQHIDLNERAQRQLEQMCSIVDKIDIQSLTNALTNKKEDIMQVPENKDLKTQTNPTVPPVVTVTNDEVSKEAQPPQATIAATVSAKTDIPTDGVNDTVLPPKVKSFAPPFPYVSTTEHKEKVISDNTTGETIDNDASKPVDAQTESMTKAAITTPEPPTSESASPEAPKTDKPTSPSEDSTIFTKKNACIALGVIGVVVVGYMGYKAVKGNNSVALSIPSGEVLGG